MSKDISFDTEKPRSVSICLFVMLFEFNKNRKLREKENIGCKHCIPPNSFKKFKYAFSCTALRVFFSLFFFCISSKGWRNVKRAAISVDSPRLIPRVSKFTSRLPVSSHWGIIARSSPVGALAKLTLSRRIFATFTLRGAEH